MQGHSITHVSATVNVYSPYLILQTAASVTISAAKLPESAPVGASESRKSQELSDVTEDSAWTLRGPGLPGLSALEDKPDSAGGEGKEDWLRFWECSTFEVGVWLWGHTTYRAQGLKSRTGDKLDRGSICLRPHGLK